MSKAVSTKATVTTITLVDVAENHARMQKIGTLHDKGYSIEQLQALGESLRSAYWRIRNDAFVLSLVSTFQACGRAYRSDSTGR